MASAQGVRSSNPPLIWREILRLEKAPNLPTKIDFPETCYFCELDDLETFSFFGIFSCPTSVIRRRSFFQPDQAVFLPDQAVFGSDQIRSLCWAPDQPPEPFLGSGSTSGWIFPYD